MSVSYKGLLNGNISAVDVARAVAKLYGGDQFNIRFGNDSTIDWGLGLGAGIDGGHFVITFDQEFSPEVKAMRPWERKASRVGRMMHVFTDGYSSGDYASLTKEPMTCVSLGHWGDCKEIVNALVAHFGGFVLDEGVEGQWKILPGYALEAAADRVAALQAEREAALARRDAREAAKA